MHMAPHKHDKSSPKPWLLVALAIPLVILGLTTLKSLNPTDMMATQLAQSRLMANADHDGDEHGDHHMTGGDDPIVMLNTVEEGVERLTPDTEPQNPGIDG